MKNNFILCMCNNPLEMNRIYSKYRHSTYCYGFVSLFLRILSYYDNTNLTFAVIPMKFYARKMLLNSPKAYVHVRLDCIHIRLI